MLIRGFPGGSEVHVSALQCRRPGFDLWVGKIPGEGNGNPIQYSCLKTSMDREARQATVSWGHKELDTTEQLTDTHSSHITSG